MRFFAILSAVMAAASAASIATEYLPPVSDNILPSQEYLVPETNEEPTVLSDDGYHYKVIRRLKLRHRREINELPSSEYLPPSEESQEKTIVDAVPEEKTFLADDGYRYKTVRRLKYRHRRDITELPSNEYLPASEDPQEEAAPEGKTAAVDEVVPEEKTILAEDGYRYKTVRRLKYRHRRDVNELPSSEYLPPTAEKSADLEIAVQYPEETVVLPDDGYRYKTVRKLKYRQKYRRDVNELPSIEYLSPSAEKSADLEVAEQYPEETVVLADDGYRYKTVRKLKYRRH